MLNIAIVPAAGFGRRFASNTAKQYIKLAGRPVIIHVLEALEACNHIHRVLPVASADELDSLSDMIKHSGFSRVATPIAGGVERQDSVYNALKLLDAESTKPDYVTVHDGVRPLATAAMHDSAVQALIDCTECDGVIVAVPPKDTIKQASEDGIVTSTPERQTLWSVQTPQVFRFSSLMDAYNKAYAGGLYSTDDSALVESAGGKVKVIMGDYANIKITTPEDMALAETLIEQLNN